MKIVKSVFWIAFVVLGAATMVGLGFWQLRRLQERRAENVLIANHLSQPPLTITGNELVMDATEYQPVIVRGVYDFSDEIVLRNRARSNVAGVHVLTPLLIEGSDRAVLVDRGWIPYEYSTRAQRQPYAYLEGIVTVTGLVRVSQERTGFIGPVDPPINADNPQTDAWFWINIPHIQFQFRNYKLLPFYIEQDETADPNALPAPGHELDLSEGPHLSYAIQWFSFAIILVVGSVALWRSNEKRQAESIKVK